MGRQQSGDVGPRASAADRGDGRFLGGVVHGGVAAFLGSDSFEASWGDGPRPGCAAAPIRRPTRLLLRRAPRAWRIETYGQASPAARIAQMARAVLPEDAAAEFSVVSVAVLAVLVPSADASAAVVSIVGWVTTRGVKR